MSAKTCRYTEEIAGTGIELVCARTLHKDIGHVTEGGTHFGAPDPMQADELATP